MLRSSLLGIGSGLRLAFLPIFDKNADAVTIKTPITESGDDPNETGWDRVRAIFQATYAKMEFCSSYVTVCFDFDIVSLQGALFDIRRVERHESCWFCWYHFRWHLWWNVEGPSRLV